MTMLAAQALESRATVAIGDSPASFSAIRHSDCAAAIWQRQFEPEFQNWINALVPATLPRARVILPPSSVRETVSQICHICETPEHPERDRLVNDVSFLAEIFADLMNAKWLRLRFDVVTTNACRKFHIDAVTARLVCTYRGTGTQYGHSTDSAEPESISTVNTGSPIVLRGTNWPVDSETGLLHRSPPIEGSGETRLLLVLDPLDSAEDQI